MQGGAVALGYRCLQILALVEPWQAVKPGQTQAGRWLSHTQSFSPCAHSSQIDCELRLSLRVFTG